MFNNMGSEWILKHDISTLQITYKYYKFEFYNSTSLFVDLDEKNRTGEHKAGDQLFLTERNLTRPSDLVKLASRIRIRTRMQIRFRV